MGGIPATQHALHRNEIFRIASMPGKPHRYENNVKNVQICEKSRRNFLSLGAYAFPYDITDLCGYTFVE